MWTRVFVDGETVVEVRGQPDSHWAYVVSRMSPTPKRISSSGQIRLKTRADYSLDPVRYTFDAEVPI
eukprot:UN3110